MSLEQISEDRRHPMSHTSSGQFAAEPKQADWATCPTCNGSGCRTWDGTEEHRESYDCEPCPDCVDGMTPTPELVERMRAAGYLVIGRDEKGEWPIKLRGLLGSWAHRWPGLPANSVLDTLYDTLAIDGLASRQGDTEL